MLLFFFFFCFLFYFILLLLLLLFFFFFVLRITSGPRVKFVDSKRSLTTPSPVVYATDRSKAVVPVLFLFYVAL